MESFTNNFGITFRVGQKGVLMRNFSKNENPKTLTVVGFSPSGSVIKCQDDRGFIYNVNSSNRRIRGSHMGNAYVIFK